MEKVSADHLVEVRRGQVQGRQLELRALRVGDVRKQAVPHQQPEQHAPHPALAVQPCAVGMCGCIQGMAHPGTLQLFLP